MLKRIFKASIQLIAEDYWNGWLYAVQTQECAPVGNDVSCAAIEGMEELSNSRFEEIRRQAWTREVDTWIFGAWVDGELAAVCWIQARETLRRRGGLFDLGHDEAELAQITTARSFRGHGIATRLIQYATLQMRISGFRKLYAKIWHDNRASIRAFERAGWKLEKRFFSLRLRRRQKPVVLRLPMIIGSV
jgi:RimJ/RimL family protein N-acetyltransferase